MKKILIIDDSKTVRTLCEQIHKGLEDKVLTAGSVAEATSIIQSEKPEVIFVDYTLPDGNVIDFIRSHAGAGVGIVMMGGSYADFDEGAAKAAGAVDIIVKPFKTDEFFAAEARAYEASQGEPKAAVGVTSSPSSVSVPPPIGAPKRFNFPGGSNVSSSPANMAVPRSSVSNISSISNVVDPGVQQAATPQKPILTDLASSTGMSSRQEGFSSFSAPSNSGLFAAHVDSGVATRSSISGIIAQPDSGEHARPEAAISDGEAMSRQEIIKLIKRCASDIIIHYIKNDLKPYIDKRIDQRVEAILARKLNQ